MKTYAEYEEYYEKNLKDLLAGYPEITKEVWINSQWEIDNRINRYAGPEEYSRQRSNVLSCLPEDERNKFMRAGAFSLASALCRYIADLKKMGIYTDDEE